MDETLKENLIEPMSKLPESLQRAINSFDWLKKCEEIGGKYNIIDIDEVGHGELAGLKAEVALVLVGLSDLDTLHRYIDVEIGGTRWQELEREIIENILDPIGEIWEIIEKYKGY
jgi:hypothetical protein